MRKILLGLTFTFLLSHSLLGQTYVPKSDWKSHFICQKDSRVHKDYCLEIVEIPKSGTKEYDGVILLIPGLLQNAHIYDLAPEKGISVARYVESKFNMKIYILNIRTVGNSTYIKNTSLDDIAIDDIPNAIKYIYQLENKKVSVIGHSQGAITLNASMSGLTRCGKNHCFKKKVGISRQELVKNIGLLAGDNRLKMEQNNPVLHLSKFIQAVKPSWKLFDKVNLELLSHLIGPIGYLDIWDVLVNEDNVSDSSKKLLLERSIDSTSIGIIDQFTKAVLRGDIKSISGESYADNSINVKVPLYQQIYGVDWLSPAKSVAEDSFLHIGSNIKRLELFPNQGHEDFMINFGLHSNLDSMINFFKQN
jgi:pimeloyl-ACP methyl ester carboxylesterase